MLLEKWLGLDLKRPFRYDFHFAEPFMCFVGLLRKSLVVHLPLAVLSIYPRCQWYVHKLLDFGLGVCLVV